MPPKKAEKKAADDPDGDPGMSPANLLSNYQKVCRSSAVAINQKVVETLTNEDQLEVFLKTSQLVVDDEHGPLGATGTRALCSAILGLGQGLSGAPCKLVKSLRIWRGGAGDDGAACLAELLRCEKAASPVSAPDSRATLLRARSRICHATRGFGFAGGIAFWSTRL
ncbi:hypothetical protein M885DRAFT_179787 [Pelagophyceae sp. CCMP2097]|nr:hypothetical protein M885DRAFT_179787 [Pelagophyceae sp. CCMP2097]